MIEVKISEDAREYILNRAEAITVDLVADSGCYGAANVPLVFEGKPSLPENYDEVIADGIKVYFLKEAFRAPDGARIFLEGNKLAYQCLGIEGLIYDLTPIP